MKTMMKKYPDQELRRQPLTTCLGEASRLSIIALACLLPACAVNSPQAPGPMAVSAGFKEAGLWKSARATQPGAVPDVSESWWEIFHDPVLNGLQQKLLTGNENLKSAATQVASAKAVLKASQTALWPTLSATAGATRSSNPGAGQNARTTSNSYSAGLETSWEIDLWGRLSKASEAANASLQASRDDFDAVRLSAQATLTQTYFAMRAAEAQQSILQRTTASNQRSLELTQARFNSGVAGQSDVLQAKIQLTTTQVQLKDAEAQRAQLEHAIAVLLGMAPAGFSLEKTASLPDVPPVPEFVPSTLLERRPDIAAAERKVAAAYAQIGVKDAAFFPDFSLSANAGYRSSSLSNLFDSSTLLWSLGSSMAASIFDGGAKRLASDQARASADAAVAAYRQTVLTSLQEVEDNLVVLDQLQGESQLQAEAVQAAQRNLDITQAQYKAGTVSYLNVVISQNAALSSESNLLSIRNRQLAAVNVLLKNIGGRWQKT
ncbi:efflux transporter outer membrane subunit [Undibacterium sp. TS12]|uniref:efflux transporter outer membrane subunit n=1 Tax=Undibacterium sp. TS12 TaxID=2908202 RepID=UPI001F4D004C|nr:efflux transporter outer membrane subunit [Undibacterium sp. TS12]MCH8618695.1 efflux transporter outer membrane subunit [Undibacterium sp. TS12]